MKLSYKLIEVLTAARRVDPRDLEEGWTEADEWPTERLIDTLRDATRLRQSLNAAIKDMTRALDGQLGGRPDTDPAGGEWKIGRRQKRKCVDPDGLASFIGKDWPRCFNPSTAKIGALRTLAAERDISMTAVNDSFFEIQWVAGTLTYKAPE